MRTDWLVSMENLGKQGHVLEMVDRKLEVAVEQPRTVAHPNQHVEKV
jgi:hypothetical protein